MNINRKIERSMFSAPEVCQEDFRMPSKAELWSMCSIWFQNMGKPRLFIKPFEEEGHLILELYFWDLTQYDWVQRIILEPGKQLDEKSEDLFLSICERTDVTIDPEDIAETGKRCGSCFPEIHLPEYNNHPEHLLLHVYFATWRSGPMEILYKANLDYMGETLHKMDEYDLVASSPTGLMGGLPIRLLRMLNNSWGKDLLLTGEKRQEVLAVYRRFSHILKNNLPLTEKRYEYLRFCMEEQLEWNSKSFRFVEMFDEMELFYEYLDYLKLRKKLKEELGGSMVFPAAVWSVDDMLTHIHQAEELYQILGNREKYNYNLRQQYTRNNHVCYEDAENLVILPRSLEDIIKEANEQKNCLISYISEVVSGDTIICFWRKRKDPYRSYITMEISGSELLQAYGRCNRRLTEKEKNWLEEVYCPAAHLDYEEDPEGDLNLLNIFHGGLPGQRIHLEGLPGNGTRGEGWLANGINGEEWPEFDFPEEDELPFN